MILLLTFFLLLPTGLWTVNFWLIIFTFFNRLSAQSQKNKKPRAHRSCFFLYCGRLVNKKGLRLKPNQPNKAKPVLKRVFPKFHVQILYDSKDIPERTLSCVPTLTITSLLSKLMERLKYQEMNISRKRHDFSVKYRKS